MKKVHIVSATVLIVLVYCIFSVRYLLFKSSRLEIETVMQEMDVNPKDSPIKKKDGLIIIGGDQQYIGDLGRYEQKEHRFEILNDTKETLSIDSIRASCGCLGSYLSSPKQCMPGSQIVVAVNIGGQATVDGRLYSVTVLFENHEPIMITFSYGIVGDVFAKPYQIRIEKIYVGEKREGAILLIPEKNIALDIIEINSSSQFVKIIGQERVGRSIRVIYYVYGENVGKQKARIIINTNANIDSQIVIPVEWEVIPIIQILPRTIFWGNLEIGEEKQRKITLQSINESPFTILDIVPENTGPTMKIQPISTSRKGMKEYTYIVTVVAQSNFNGESFQKTIRFLTDQGEIIFNTYGTIF